MIGSLFGSMINAMSQSNANATNELIATQNRVAAQNEAQLSRQWQKYMVDYQNLYNSPAAQIVRGLNPLSVPLAQVYLLLLVLLLRLLFPLLRLCRVFM